MKKNTALIMLLVLSNIGWFVAYAFAKLDHGITLTYQAASDDTSQKMLDQAIIVANKNLVGVPLSEAIEKIGQDTYGSQPFVKDGCLYAGGLCLEISSAEVIGKVRAE
ncbi:hypothetical protein [uncultured Microbulbifer sp.]|uniref:hypothetical protein n=1 Tax=uncultured Microbulbifer sp. TaxID=348147 RepID=UPI002622DE5C|nr:hypothetical protein [uncultured Microbulbifer sp.]